MKSRKQSSRKVRFLLLPLRRPFKQQQRKRLTPCSSAVTSVVAFKGCRHKRDLQRRCFIISALSPKWGELGNPGPLVHLSLSGSSERVLRLLRNPRRSATLRRLGLSERSTTGTETGSSNGI